MKITKRQLRKIIKEKKSDDYLRGLSDGREDQAAEEMGGQVYGPDNPGDPSYMAGYAEGFESLGSSSSTLTNRITERQLKRIVKEEKQKLNEQAPPGQVISAAEKGLAAIMLDKILRGDKALENEIYQYMADIGFEDYDIQAGLDQLADRYNL